MPDNVQDTVSHRIVQPNADKLILDHFFTQNEDRPSDHIQRVVGPAIFEHEAHVHNARFFLPDFVPSLAAGAYYVSRCDEIPEYWHISIPPLAAVRIDVFPGAFNPGVGAKPLLRLAGGGSCRLPIRSKEITLLNTAAVSTDINIIATRGLDYDINIGALA